MDIPIPPKPIEVLAVEGVDWAIAELKRRENESITKELEELDRKSLRALRAYAIGASDEVDEAALEELEKKARSLRAKLR